MSTINKSAAQLNATILSNKRVGAYHQILLAIGDLLQFAVLETSSRFPLAGKRPGWFYAEHLPSRE